MDTIEIEMQDDREDRCLGRCSYRSGVRSKGLDASRSFDVFFFSSAHSHARAEKCFVLVACMISGFTSVQA